MSDLFNTSGAEFSPCRNYRYVLWRTWGGDFSPRVAFIGLNPSTANEAKSDPTITRVKGFARDWGFGGFYMLNLFAIVSSDPKVLTTCADPLGENDQWLKRIAGKCDLVVFAWGSFKEAKKREMEVIGMFPEAVCLKKSKAGNPWHPLYVRGDVTPIRFATNEPWRGLKA